SYYRLDVRLADEPALDGNGDFPRPARGEFDRALVDAGCLCGRQPERSEPRVRDAPPFETGDADVSIAHRGAARGIEHADAVIPRQRTERVGVRGQYRNTREGWQLVGVCQRNAGNGHEDDEHNG